MVIMTARFEEAAQGLRSAIGVASKGLVDRELLIELIMLCAVAREHLLIIGPPGTAKSAAVRRVAKVLGGEYFEYLLGRFTEPSEIFGPVDLKKLRDGTVETSTAGMLPEANVAFLDEIFLGSTAVLNTLLGILNERRFRRGHTLKECPLRVCAAATNALPEEESLAAFADRFLVRVFVEPIPDYYLEDLLEGGWKMNTQISTVESGLQYLDVLSETAQQASVEAVQPLLAHCIRKLRSSGLYLSDRRIVQSQRLVSAAAALAGRSSPSAQDLWPLVYCIPTNDGQQLARELLYPELQESESQTLAAAAEDASASAAARAKRIVTRIEELLPNNGDGESLRYQLESLAREIDAGFHSENMPETLQQARQKLIERIDEFPSARSN